MPQPGKNMAPSRLIIWQPVHESNPFAYGLPPAIRSFKLAASPFLTPWKSNQHNNPLVKIDQDIFPVAQRSNATFAEAQSTNHSLIALLKRCTLDNMKIDRMLIMVMPLLTASVLPAQSAATWEIGPFTRPANGNPVITPSPQSTFTDPVLNASIHWEILHTFNP